MGVEGKQYLDSRLLEFPRDHPLESVPLGQASAGSNSSNPKPGAHFFLHSLLFRLPALEVSPSLSLSIFRIHSNSVDEYYPQHSTPLSLQNSSLTLRRAVLDSGGTPTMTPPTNEHLPCIISFKPRPRDRSFQCHHPLSQMGELRSVMKSHLPRSCAY